MVRTSSRTFSAQFLCQREGEIMGQNMPLKPFGFCCSMDHFDPLSKYDQRRLPYESTLTKTTSVHECPVSKIQVEFAKPYHSRQKRKITNLKIQDQQPLITDDKLHLQSINNNYPLQWYLEDEVALAKDIFWMEKQKIYNEETDKAIIIAKKKHKSKVKNLLSNKYPRWYQDFSSDQIKNLMRLENVMRTDYHDMTTRGTETTLIAIGVISTFFKLKPNNIRELHKSCNLNSIDFLREIYKILTGNDFHKEGYKKFYDCNERIILSAIAFLTLPETVEELHRRLPIIMPKLPPKPKSPLCPPRQKSTCPYKEGLFKSADWSRYKNDLQKWRKQYKSFAIPKIILPRKQYTDKETLFDINKKQEKDMYAKYFKEINGTALRKDLVIKIDRKDQQGSYSDENLPNSDTEKSAISQLSNKKRKFDLTFTELDEKPEALEYKACVTLKPPKKQKSWLGEKDAHQILAGASDDLSSCPISYEIAGIANVTPSNSDERFFSLLKLENECKKDFPKGRENLSRNWQEWLHKVEEEFRPVEKEANKLIKNVENTMKLVFPEPTCDSCCSCRQTRKTYKKWRETKTPYLLIDNIIEDKDKKKYIIGTMAMHSPAPSPTESAVDVQVIASEEKIKTNIIINQVANENGKIQYCISGVQKDKTYIPSQVFSPVAPQSIKNVPPCECAIQQMFKKNISPSWSTDDIPWTKNEGQCFGKKYRPDKQGAYSCTKYPGDKSCRRNPFIKHLVKKRKEIKKKKDAVDKEMDGFMKVDKLEQFIYDSREAELLERKRKERLAKEEKISIKEKSRKEEQKKEMKEKEKKKLKEERKKEMEEKKKKKTEEEKKKETEEEEKEEAEEKKKKEMEKKKKKRAIIKTTKISSVLQKRRKEVIDKLDEKEISREISRIARKKIKEEKKRIEEIKKKRAPGISPRKITTDDERVKVPGKISKPITITKLKRSQIKPSDELTKEYGPKKIKKMRKHVLPTKKERKIDIAREAEQLDKRKRKLAKLKKKLKPPIPLSDIRPVHLRKKLPAMYRPKPKKEYKRIDIPPSPIDEIIAKEGPYGWRTKSEQELPPKKTIAYLCEPEYPLKMVAVRPGGRSCHCRENRSKKKVLMYNVGGLVDKQAVKSRYKKVCLEEKGKETRLKQENRIIDGVFYLTPPPSPRKSDEYVPEYDLAETPYDMCVGEHTDKLLKLTERYSGPKGLIKKIRKTAEACSCSNYVDMFNIDERKDIEETQQKLMESKLPEERWEIALKDVALMDYFTGRRNNVPCWTCAKLSRDDKLVRNTDFSEFLLKVMKPVCECKYERKILERNEEKMKWKERQQKLKSLKKESYMHIIDILRSMETDTKLMISDGTEKIPGKIENINDNCITDATEDLRIAPPIQIVEGLKMSSPFETPKTSREDIPHILHRHWSPTRILPGPLPRRDDALKKEIKRKQQIRDEALNYMYGGGIDQDVAQLEYRCCSKTCNQEEMMTNVKKNLEMEKSNINMIQRMPERYTAVYPSNKKTNRKIDHQQNVSSIKCKKISSERIHEKRKHLEEAGIDHRQDKQLTEKIEKEDSNRRLRGGGDEGLPTGKLDLMEMMKTELKKMAAEGYIFATLPDCYLVPQLQDWIMYRKGIAFTEAYKKKSRQAVIAIWQLMKVIRMPRIKVPSLNLTKDQLKKLTFDRAEEMKRKIAAKKAIFHSEIRKTRVAYARSMWTTMDFGKFPSTSFKNAYFTYMAGKEADGHVFRPWMPCDIRERDPECTCF